MKFYVKKTDIYTEKNIPDANIICITDLHYTKTLTPQFLLELTNKIKVLNPKYICFLGDLCDDNSYSDVIEWLNMLSKISPVYFIYGNHDIAKYRIDDKTYHVSSSLPGHICKEIKNISNLKVLTKNKVDADDGYSFCGVNFYNDSNYNLFVSYMNKHIPNFNSENFNFLLSHNPKTMEPQIFEQLDEDYQNDVDCIISGHTHNGLVMSSIDKIIPGNKGFYLKAKGLLPTYTRGNLTQNNYEGIICPPLRTLPDRNVILRKANDLLYNPGIQLVRVKQKNEK